MIWLETRKKEISRGSKQRFAIDERSIQLQAREQRLLVDADENKAIIIVFKGAQNIIPEELLCF